MKRTRSLMILIITMMALVWTDTLFLDSEANGGRSINDSSDTTATTGDTFHFEVNVTSYDWVEVEYYFGSDNSTVVNMTYSAGSYYHNITVPLNSTESLHYQFLGYYNDSGIIKNDNTTLVNITVTDNDPPEIGTDHAPTSVRTSVGEVDFDISNVTDNAGTIASVYLEVRFYDKDEDLAYKEIYPNEDIPKLNGHYVIEFPFNEDITRQIFPNMKMWYNYTVKDSNGNRYDTSAKSIDIIDDSPPTIEDQTFIKYAPTTDDYYDFIYLVEDNCELQLINLEVNEDISGGFGDTHYLSGSYENDYFHETIPEWARWIEYSFKVYDWDFNYVQTSPIRLNVTDNDDPFITEDNTENVTYTGNWHNFTVDLHDNIAIDDVFVNYSYGGFNWKNTSMKNDPASPESWYHNITVEDTLQSIEYKVFFNDTSDNRENSTLKTVRVLDDDLPELSRDMTQSIVTTGEELIFWAVLTDNIEVHTAWVNYRYGEDNKTIFNRSLTRTTQNNWSFNIKAYDTLHPIYYSFHYNDTSNNWNHTEERTITVIDDDRPFLISDHTPEIAVIGQTLNFQAQISDNIGIEWVWAEYRYGEGATNNISLSKVGENYWSVQVDVEHILEDIQYRLFFNDTSGNYNTTMEKMITVFDYTQPDIMEMLTTENATTGDMYEFSVFVWDNIEVSNVWVLYWYGDGLPEILDLTYLDIEGKWHNWTTVPHSLDQFHYIIYANDTSGNEVNTTEYTVNVTDNDIPFLAEDLSLEEGTTGDLFHFNINLTDNVGIVGAYVEYWFDGSHDTVPLEISNVYTAQINLPSDYVGPLHYVVHFNDTSNMVFSAEFTSTVVDNDRPEVLTNFTKSEAGTGDILNFSVSVRDNIAIENVAVTLSGGTLPSETFNLSFVNGSYEGFIEIPAEAFGTITYYFTVEDTYENIIVTHPSNITIIDTIEPWIGPIDDLMTYEGVQFEVPFSATDNIGIVEVLWEGSTSVVRVDNTFKGTIDQNGFYNITITVKDAALNFAHSSFKLTVLADDHDTDMDGIPDLYELSNGMNMSDGTDAQMDPDKDNLTNLQEYYYGTEPRSNDTDSDGMLDGLEVKYDLNPLNPSDASLDKDSDGISNLEEILMGTDPGVFNEQDEGKKDQSDFIIPFIVFGVLLSLVILMVLIVVKVKSTGKTIIVGGKKGKVTTKKDSKVFISYSSKDEDQALSVCVNLERRGIKCWIAPRDIVSGESYGGSIVNAINNSLVLVLIYSKNSDASPQVLREVERAVSKKIKIIPVRIDDTKMSQDMEYFISSSHWLNATQPPLEKHMGKIEEAVRGMLELKEREIDMEE